MRYTYNNRNCNKYKINMDYTRTALQAFEERYMKGPFDTWKSKWHALRKGDAMAKVNESQKMALCDIPDSPFLPSKEVMELRLSLLKEELAELERGIQENNIVEIYDALLDLEVVLKGTVSTFGFNNVFEKGLNEVCASNYTKAREDGIFNVNGINMELDTKYPKGKFLKDKRFYHKPNLVKVLWDSCKTQGEKNFLITNVLNSSGVGNVLGFHLIYNPESDPCIRIRYQGSEWFKSHDFMEILSHIEEVFKLNIFDEEKGLV